MTIIIPDQIEAGTYMAAVAAAGGEVLIKNVIPKHLDCITAKLVEMGVEVEEQDDALLLRREGRLGRVNVKTMPYHLPFFLHGTNPDLVFLVHLLVSLFRVIQFILLVRNEQIKGGDLLVNIGDLGTQKLNFLINDIFPGDNIRNFVFVFLVQIGRAHV